MRWHLSAWGNDAGESPALIGLFLSLESILFKPCWFVMSGIAERLERTGISNLSQATFGEARRSFADCSQAASYRKILKELDVQWLCFRFQRFSGFASWQWFCHAARHGRICDGLLDLGVELKEARCSRRILMWHLDCFLCLFSRTTQLAWAHISIISLGPLSRLNSAVFGVWSKLHRWKQAISKARTGKSCSNGRTDVVLPRADAMMMSDK